MNNRHEYGLDNERGHEKVFTLQKTPDPEMLAIFDARRAAFAEPRRRMDRAKYMFAEIVDRALNPRCPGFIRKGSVRIPDSELARKFGVWESTIYTWKKQLELCGYIWISKEYRSDKWPQTIYNLACLLPRPTSTQNADGTSNFGPGRGAPGKPGEPTGTIDKTGQPKFWSNGARKPGQKSLPLATPHVPPVPWNAPSKKPKISDLLAIGAVRFDLHWLPATAQTGCEPQPAPAESHGVDRLTAGAHTGSQPRPNGADSHGGNGATATAKRGLKRVSDKRLSSSETRGKGNPPPDLGIEDFKKQWRGSFLRERQPFIAKLRADMAQAAEADKPWFQERIDFLKWMDTGGRPPTAKRIALPSPNITTAKPEKLNAREAELAEGFARRLRVKVAA